MYLLVLASTFLLPNPSVVADSDPIKVSELTFPVPGTRAAAEFQKNNPGREYLWAHYYYGFEQGDVVVIDLEMEEGKGTYNFEVQEYGSKSVLFSRRDIKKLRKVKVSIPARGVYDFIVKGNHTEPSTCQMTIHRIPAPGPNRNFNTNVTWNVKTDTIYKYVEEKYLAKTNFIPEVLVDKTFRVFSKAKIGSPSRITIPFTIPANTAHWVYWVGVGQESVKELEELAKTLSKGGAAALSGINPVAAFGMGLIPNLPPVKSSGYIDFFFMKPEDEKAFREEGTRKPLPFAKGDAIINAYGKIAASQTPKTTNNTLFMGLENTNTVTGLDVAVKLMAFRKENIMETRKVKKLDRIEETRVPVFGN